MPAATPPTEQTPNAALTELLSSSLADQPVTDTSFVELLTESTTSTPTA
ncbi:MAG: hypothetical protein HEQ38_04485 [Gemmatimonas sp.]|nr:hypothetical protein [Gemmatimonas sp.]